LAVAAASTISEVAVLAGSKSTSRPTRQPVRAPSICAPSQAAAGARRTPGSSESSHSGQSTPLPRRASAKAASAGKAGGWVTRSPPAAIEVAA